MQSFIKKRLEEFQNILSSMYNDEDLLKEIEKIAIVLQQRLGHGATIFFCGNGGSAADSQHLATELACRFFKIRPAIRAQALGTNISFTTAVSNDLSFDNIFARDLEVKGKSGDCIILISTSGSSLNILKAQKQAKSMNILTIGFSGNQGNELLNSCDYSMKIPSNSVPRIQEAYMLIGHILCEYLENFVVSKNENMR